MATPTFSISGLASGLDTASIVSQLMQLEQRPVQILESRKAELAKVDNAWVTVNTKLSSLRAAIDKISKPGAFGELVKTTSSDESAVTAIRSGTPASGAVTFTVTGLAASDQKAVGGTFAAADTVLGAGALTVGQGEDSHTVDTDGKTLAQVAAELNEELSGVSAQVVKLSEGQYQLLVSAKATGTANAVDVDTSGAPAGLQSTTVLRAAADATIDLGGGVVVTRSSNTVTDLVEGLTLTLKKAGETVTVTTEPDADAAVDAVKSFVNALNSTLSTLSDLTKYDAGTDTAGVLQGDPTARQLILDLRGSLSQAVTGIGSEARYQTFSAVGISADRYGVVQIDEEKLRAALETGFADVEALFTRSSRSQDSRVRLTGTTSAVASGTYSIDVTTAAAIASATGAVYTPPGSGYPKTFSVTTAKGTVEITLTEAEATVAAAVAKINAALSAEASAADGVRASGTEDGLGIRFTAASAGSAHTIAIDDPDGVLGTITTTAGSDVVVSHEGQTYTGVGGAVNVAGMALVVSAGVTGTLGPIVVANGLDAALTRAEGRDGSIQRARDTVDRRMRAYQDSIDAYDVRLAHRESTLRRKYAALESAILSMQSQSAWMAAQFAAPAQ